MHYFVFSCHTVNECPFCSLCSVVDFAFLCLFLGHFVYQSVQFSRLVVSDSLRPMDCSMPRLPVHRQVPEFTQTHVHSVGDAIQPSPLSSPSPAFNLSQHQGPFNCQFFAVGGQSTEVSASASVLPMNMQD